MLEPKMITLGTERPKQFQLLGIPVQLAAKMNKKVLTMLVPLLGGFDELSLESKVDMEKVARGLTMALQDLDDMTHTQLITDTLAYVTYIGPEGAVELKNKNLDLVFSGDLDLMYQVIFESWRHNKFTPFVLLERFGGLDQILTSKKGSNGQKQSGIPLVKSDSLTPG